MNNGAGALLLALNTLARDKAVLVSRSELVEIGGGFRVPEIMEASGCTLVEVGTTNKTRLEDYARKSQAEAVGPPEGSPVEFRAAWIRGVGTAGRTRTTGKAKPRARRV